MIFSQDAVIKGNDIREIDAIQVAHIMNPVFDKMRVEMTRFQAIEAN
jgi:hypothetical protein